MPYVSLKYIVQKHHHLSLISPILFTSYNPVKNAYPYMDVTC